MKEKPQVRIKSIPTPLYKNTSLWSILSLLLMSIEYIIIFVLINKYGRMSV